MTESEPPRNPSTAPVEPAAPPPSPPPPAAPPYAGGGHTQWRARARRVWALVKKESRQIVRDPSSVALGVVLPVVLILLYGYGLSLDVRNVPVAMVFEDRGPQAQELAADFRGSPYFAVRTATDMQTAEEWMIDREVDGIVRIPADFSRQMAAGSAEVQVIVHGTDANHARIVQIYARGAAGVFAARQAADGRGAAAGPVVLQTRMWFNEAADSHYFLVPGLVVLIMTLIGAFLTAMVMAREWERGTLEALFVTPVRTGEILIGKVIPYFGLGMIGLALCVLAAQFLFHVPFRGSIVILLGASMVYLLLALGIGLLISSAVKNQFVASQIALLATFLPALMLSGFLFDLRSMPLPVWVISHVVPARYFVALLQTVFLAGNVWSVIVPNGVVLVGIGVLVFALTQRVTRKRLG